MLTFNISLAVLLSVALLLSEKKLRVKANCNANTGTYGCGPKEYCCKKHLWLTNVCRSGGCVGEICSWNGACGGPGECCSLNNACTKNTSLCHECSSDSDCGNNMYCCKQQYSYQRHVCRSGGCVGQPCYSNSSCGGPSECCNLTNYCTKPPCHECLYNNCDQNEYCCKQRYSWQRRVCSSGAGCVGQPCRSDSDCGGPGECCNSTNYCTKSGCTQCSSDLYCGYNRYCCKQGNSNRAKVCGHGGCVGEFCSSDSDCGGPSECCDSSEYCTESHNCHEHVLTKGLASWLIAVIVVSVLVAVAIPIVIIVCFYRGMASASRGRTQQGQVLNQPTGSTIPLQNTKTVQNNPAQIQYPPYSPPPYSDDGQGPSQGPLLNQVAPPAYILSTK